MTQLIPLQSQTIDGNAVETVSARELHTFLEVGRDFSTWIKDRISKYEFVENTDYIMLPKTGELENKGLQGKIEYDFIENQDFVRFHKKMKANNATMIEYYITLAIAKRINQ